MRGWLEFFVTAACAGLIGFVWGQDVERRAKAPVPVVDLKRLDEIDLRVRALEARKCVAIQTERFDMMVITNPLPGGPLVARKP